MCPPGYHHSGFVGTHALWHITYGSSCDETVYHVPKCMSCHKNHCGDNRDEIYAHLASVKYEHSVCRRSVTTTYIYI